MKNETAFLLFGTVHSSGIGHEFNFSSSVSNTLGTLYPDQFGWEYLEQGSEVWHVAITKK